MKLRRKPNLSQICEIKTCKIVAQIAILRENCVFMIVNDIIKTKNPIRSKKCCLLFLKKKKSDKTGMLDSSGVSICSLLDLGLRYSESFSNNLLISILKVPIRDK